MSEQEKGAKYLDTFMGAVNADHIDVIPVSRERGRLMRDEIIRLREVEEFWESWNKKRRIIDGLTAPIQEKLGLDEKLRSLVDEWITDISVDHLVKAACARELEALLDAK